MPADLTGKYDRLRSRVSNLGSVLVAYSGGVDSTLVAFTAHAVLEPDSCLAVLALSDTHPPPEVETARAVARECGFRLIEVDTHELADSRFRANDRERCYFCKSEIFGLFRTIADTRNLTHVADGSNADDDVDQRPGARAAAELGVVSPLQDAGLHKSEIRDISEMLGLPNWDKPSMACLATRFPYGEELTDEGLQRVARAEHSLRDMGLKQFRVRSHGDLARLEVETEEMDFAWKRRDLIAEALKATGFLYVSQDLEGYRTGSLNEPLTEE
jgi:uncharacterized protein